MKRALLLTVMVALVAISAYADQNAMTANIPFSFVAAGKTLPAGEYEIRAITDDEITLLNLKTRQSVIVPVLTRLASSTPPKEAVVTFDKVNGKCFMETIWPMTDEGYLIQITKAKHTHERVRG